MHTRPYNIHNNIRVERLNCFNWLPRCRYYGRSVWIFFPFLFLFFYRPSFSLHNLFIVSFNQAIDFGARHAARWHVCEIHREIKLKTLSRRWQIKWLSIIIMYALYTEYIIIMRIMRARVVHRSSSRTQSYGHTSVACGSHSSGVHRLCNNMSICIRNIVYYSLLCFIVFRLQLAKKPLESLIQQHLYYVSATITVRITAEKRIWSQNMWFKNVKYTLLCLRFYNLYQIVYYHNRIYYGTNAYVPVF